MLGISDQSGEHLMDKISRLKQLLTGGSVPIASGHVSSRDHPEAKAYCLNFMAKKLVVNALKAIAILAF